MPLCPMEIFVRGLSFHAHHGVTLEERAVGQRVTLDLLCQLDDAAGDNDDLANSVDYIALAGLAKRVSLREGSATLEYVAKCIARECLAEFPLLQTIEVTFVKQSPPVEFDIQEVGVTITLARPGH